MTNNNNREIKKGELKILENKLELMKFIDKELDNFSSLNIEWESYLENIETLKFYLTHFRKHLIRETREQRNIDTVVKKMINTLISYKRYYNNEVNDETLFRNHNNFMRRKGIFKAYLQHFEKWN